MVTYVLKQRTHFLKSSIRLKIRKTTHWPWWRRLVFERI